MTPTEFREARQTLGLSQAAFGRMLGLTQTEISRKESGDRPISAAQALAVEALLRKKWFQENEAVIAELIKAAGLESFPREWIEVHLSWDRKPIAVTPVKGVSVPLGGPPQITR